MDDYIDEINNMLCAAYAHGGDCGGPYGSEETWMKKSVEDFLKRSNLTKEYKYGTLNRTEHNGIYSNVPQIIKI